MDPKQIAETYYKNLGKYDAQNVRRLRLAACAQLGRKAALMAKCKDMLDKQMPQDEIKVVEDEATIREQLAAKLSLYSKCVDKTIGDRELLDVQKKP